MKSVAAATLLAATLVHPGAVTLTSACDALFISEYAEGSRDNKYIEIYNQGANAIDLSNGYSLGIAINGGDPATERFPRGATVAPGDVYVVCNDRGDSAAILAECDWQTDFLKFNGNDGIALASENGYIDIVGDFGEDPGRGWDVCGVSDATRDHTLVRKEDVSCGNLYWSLSAGSDAEDCEWIVLDQNFWTNLGSHGDITLCAESKFRLDGDLECRDAAAAAEVLVKLAPDKLAEAYARAHEADECKEE